MSGMMKKVAVAVGLCWAVVSAAPEVEFSGFLDADVWADMTGGYFTNSELDLGMGIKFSDKVAAHFYVTAWSANASTPGSVPAGGALPSERWLSVDFDGFDITFDTDFGSFAVGDLVYQYGKFNYYLYKRLSMITNESFSRGLQYSIGSGMFTQQILLGVSDNAKNTVTDVQGVSKLAFSEELSLDLYYGMQNDATMDFETGSDVYVGAEFLGSFGEMLALKFDIGYKNLAGAERSNVVSVLLEPTLSMGSFSTAFTGFYMSDGDENANGGDMFGLLDEMFFYVEPGYAFTDYVAAGLPIEWHAKDIDNEDDNEFWLVPTAYIYPFENVQWWLWGQFAFPTMEGADPYFGAGSEIIVEF